MPKRSRGRVTREPVPAPITTARAARPRTRRPARRASEQPFFERYRSLIIGGIAVAGVLLIGYLFFQGGASASGYSCVSLLTPGPSEPVPTPRPATPTPTSSPSTSLSPSPSGASPSASASASAGASPTSGSPSPSGASPSPSGASPSPSGASPSPSGASPSPSGSPAASPSASPSPAPSPTARLGFTVADIGTFHVNDPNQTIEYDYCPPGSGNHYNIRGEAPMAPGAYPPSQERSPGYWVHNLEHGYTVVLYRCPSGQLGVGDCISQDEFEQLQAFQQQAPTPEVSSCANKALVVRFDQMTTRFAVMAWDRALLTDDFDLDTTLTFAEQWTEHVAVPEPLAC